MIVKRGDVYFADLSPVVGSEQGGVRPVLVIQNDIGNRFSPTVIVAAITAQIQKASSGYKDINLLAMKLLNPEGILFTFSCSGHIPQDHFQKIVSGAAVDSGRNVKIIKQLLQSADHPVSLNFPEGLYLKGLVCFVE